MVKLTNQEIDDRLNLEGSLDTKSETEMQDDAETDAVFYFNEDLIQIKTVQDRETLEQGTSYNEHMLDLNELAEKGLIGRGTKIDLSDMPEIDTLQAATEEQLMMIMPENRKQITAIHMSNNTPTGGDYCSFYHNTQKLDETIDLTSFSGLEKFETHFYVNDDLKTVKLPDSVTAVKFQHSKMENLDIMEQFNDCNIAFNNARTKKIANSTEFERICVENRFENRENDDGSYNIYDKRNDRIVADHLTGEKLQLTSPQKTSYAQKYYNDRTYYKYLCDCEVFGIKDDKKSENKFEDALILTDGKLYKPERVNPKTLEPTGNPERNIPIDIIKLTNISNKNDVRYTLQSFDGFEGMGSDLSRQSRDSGICIASSRYDVGRGFARKHVLAFKSDDNGYINPKLFSAIRDACAPQAINNYFELAEKENIALSKNDIKKKIAIAIEAEAPSLSNYDADELAIFSKNTEAYYNGWVKNIFISYIHGVKPSLKALVKATENDANKLQDFLQECGVKKEAIDKIIKAADIDDIDKNKQRQLTESKIRVNKQKYRLDSKQGKTETVEENRPVRQTEMSDEVKQKLVSDKQNG